jgi:hypothetical protein
MSDARSGAGGPVTAYLAEDHGRLDALLARACPRPRDADVELDLEAYGAFRAGLLRHIALEEKIVFPAIRAARAGEPHPDWKRLRIDHGALTSLLVPPPTPELVGELRSILEPHNQLEEAPGALYACADALPGEEPAALVGKMRAYPAVKVAPYHDGPRVLRRAEDALRLSAMQFERR